MFVKINTESEIVSYPYTMEQFYKDSKNRSLPKTITNAYLEKLNIFEVTPDEEPEYDKTTHFIIYDTTPFKNEENKWKIGWIIKKKSPEHYKMDLEAHIITLKNKINTERDTRISDGFEWNGHVFQSDSVSYENIMSVANSATAAILTGTDQDDVNWTGEETPFTWIAKDNTFVEMTPKAVIEFARAATLHKSSHFLAARNLKNMETIPEDYADDKWWS